MEKSLLFLTAAFSVVTSSLVNYTDLQTLGVACRPRDTCSNTTGRTFWRSSCECDSWCHAFDDCCVDAPGGLNQNGVQHRLGLKCLEVEVFQGVYAIQKCSDSWNGSDVVRSKCEDEDDLSDPLLSVPTTDTRTNVTYRNHYCAECNYGGLDRLSSWNITLSCTSLEDLNRINNNITTEFIERNIARSGSSWGVYQWNESLGDTSFYPCEVSFQFPDGLKPHVRYCRPQIISTCPADWKREMVRKYCLSYMAVIHIGQQGYRNAHCALCNGVSVRYRVCDYPGLTEKKKRPSLSFTLLMDVNNSDGDDVGERNPCSSGEIYDSFAKTCRRLVCAFERHVYREGRCVPQ